MEYIQTKNPQHFWGEINNLGPKRSKKIPMQVWSEGEISSDLGKVLKEWEGAFSGLFSRQEENFDHVFCDHILCLKEEYLHSNSDIFLNRDSDRDKVLKAIQAAMVKKK